MFVVYALIDPRDYTTRYVGITNDVYARFAQHLRGGDCNPEKDTWIAELKTENVMLIMKTLEVVETVEQARERETFWIHHYRFLGTLLLNQVVPSMPKRIVVQPALLKVRKPSTGQGRKFTYEKVKEIILHYHVHHSWPEYLKRDMQEWYEFYYFTKPKREEKANPKKYAQHVKAYERGRIWITEGK